jgi:hypothetical protein
MIRIIAFNIIANGVDREVIGEFVSVQMTGNELRDEDGNTILRWFDRVWFSEKSGNGWYDWTIEAVE